MTARPGAVPPAPLLCPNPPEAAQLLAVLDGIPARIALLDRERRHRYVNGEYAAFIGRPAAEIIGRTVAEVLGAEAFAQLKPFGERALRGETVHWEGWVPYHGGDGAPRFVQRVYLPRRDPAGAVEGYFVFARDLTELKRSEQRLAEQVAALRASEALATAVTAAALDCVIVADASGTVIEFNPAAERTFGYSRAEAVGQPMAELIVPPARRAAHAAGMRRYLENGQARMLGRRVEVEAMRADGSTFLAELAITEVAPTPGLRLFAAYLRDLTPAREAAAAMERQREALHQSERMAALGALLAGVGHELNNPLSIVISNVQLLQEEVEESAACAGLGGRVGRVRAAAERCAGIVRTFLAIARRGGDARKQALAPAELAKSVADALAPGLRAGGIDLRCECEPDLPRVLGDPDQLQHALSNLLLNAQQALEGRPAPRLIRVRVRGAGAWVETDVSDNGPGIPEAIRRRIFEPYLKAGSTNGGAGGVGLAVARGIVEAHGGTLQLVSPEPGEYGARFVLRLPTAPESERAAGNT